MYIPLVMMAMCVGTVYAHDLEELDQKSSRHLSSATQDISNTEIDAVEQAALDAAVIAPQYLILKAFYL